MAISLKPKHVRRYKDIARLVLKYGRTGLQAAEMTELLPAGDDAFMRDLGVDPKAEELAADLERLGPTFIKVGQFLSTRPDLLPAPYIEALSRLQDDVAPFPFEDVDQILTEELGIRISKAFSEFDPVPMAAASLSQVHRARMRDGRAVAVKVQRPDIRERIAADLEALDEIAEFLDQHTEFGRRYGMRDMMEQFRKTLLQELDYRLEERNLRTLGANLEEFDRIVVPQPVEGYTTSRVLTMDLIDGQKITDIAPVGRTEIDGAELARQLFDAYLKQVIVDGLIHADPHPGNVLLTTDSRVALIDLGTVSRIGQDMQEKLLQLLLAVSEGRGEEAAEVAIQVGGRLPHFDEAAVRRRVAELVIQHRDLTVGEIQLGRAVFAIARAAADGGLRVPPELTMLGKTMLSLDQIGRLLDPDFDAHAAIRKRAAELTTEKVWKSLSPGNLLETAIELKEFAQRLPQRVNKIMDLVANNSLEVKVDALDEARLMEGFQKVANRIAMGLVLAALIVGAALMMRVQTSFTMWGYPGLAILSFIAAAGGGVALVINILLHDRRASRETRRTGGRAGR